MRKGLLQGTTGDMGDCGALPSGHDACATIKHEKKTSATAACQAFCLHAVRLGEQQRWAMRKHFRNSGRHRLLQHDSSHDGLDQQPMQQAFAKEAKNKQIDDRSQRSVPPPQCQHFQTAQSSAELSTPSVGLLKARRRQQTKLSSGCQGEFHRITASSEVLCSEIHMESAVVINKLTKPSATRTRSRRVTSGPL